MMTTQDDVAAALSRDGTDIAERLRGLTDLLKAAGRDLAGDAQAPPAWQLAEAAELTAWLSDRLTSTTAVSLAPEDRERIGVALRAGPDALEELKRSEEVRLASLSTADDGLRTARVRLACLERRAACLRLTQHIFSAVRVQP